MGDGDAASGPPGPSITQGHVPFILWTLFWVYTLPLGLLTQICSLHRVSVVTSSFLPGPRDTKALFLGTLSTSLCAPPTNKSTVLQSHRKPGLNLHWVILGKFLSIHGLKLPHQQNGTDGNSAFLLSSCEGNDAWTAGLPHLVVVSFLLGHSLQGQGSQAEVMLQK